MSHLSRCSIVHYEQGLFLGKPASVMAKFTIHLSHAQQNIHFFWLFQNFKYFLSVFKSFISWHSELLFRGKFKNNQFHDLPLISEHCAASSLLRLSWPLDKSHTCTEKEEYILYFSGLVRFWKFTHTHTDRKVLLYLLLDWHTLATLTH